ncbi:hypothetical protein [Pontiella desulfatans]|uniref:hypothetical protein n=1 Tax=Pontiella desulfatans TaxID=2750659 RepID=UPI001443AAC7|nr:hypothetical protein [Pontiella desulfatans]
MANSTEGHLFLAQRIAVICESDHPVLSRASGRLVEALDEFRSRGEIEGGRFKVTLKGR